MSVRKREWTTRRGESKAAWVLDYRARDGKRHLETFSKKKDADARASQVAVDCQDGVHVPDSESITVAKAGKNWIARRTRDGLERGTLTQYRGHLKDYIVPGLGKVKLADLSTPHVSRFEGWMHDEKDASPVMRRKVITSLSSLLKVAMVDGEINRNVVSGYRVRDGTRGKKKIRVGVDIPTVEEIRAFLEACNCKWRPFFMTAVFTGMRVSELRGLTWADVNRNAGEIHVRQRADLYHEIGPPKSEAGDRVIPVGPKVLNALRHWQLGCPWSPLGLVFPTRLGNVQSTSNIRKRGLMPTMEKAGIVDENGRAKYTGLHALRHFYASWLINPRENGGQGQSPKSVQAKLGHSTLAMTMDTYAHLFPSDDDPEQLRAAEIALVG
ncbi:MAG: site-specific integrase [Hyphomicrobium sp.]|nr:site-specific integrase [Hyphomicrobium sp.]